MNANDFVLLLSAVVSVFIIVWAVIFIRSYDDLDKN